MTPQFPAQFIGNYFFADFCGGWIRRLDPSAGNAISDFATGVTVQLIYKSQGMVFFITWRAVLVR